MHSNKTFEYHCEKAKLVGVSDETVYWNEIRWEMEKREQFNAII